MVQFLSTPALSLPHQGGEGSKAREPPQGAPRPGLSFLGKQDSSFPNPRFPFPPAYRRQVGMTE